MLFGTTREDITSWYDLESEIELIESNYESKPVCLSSIVSF